MLRRKPSLHFLRNASLVALFGLQAARILVKEGYGLRCQLINTIELAVQVCIYWSVFLGEDPESGLSVRGVVRPI
jgi:hypothetical protein